MKFKFNNQLDIIEVNLTLVSFKEVNAKAILDTGSNNLVIIPRLAEELQLEVSTKKSHILTVDQHHIVPLVIVPKLLCLGYEARNVNASVFGLPEKTGVEIIIGLKFLKQFSDMHISFKKGYIELTR